MTSPQHPKRRRFWVSFLLPPRVFDKTNRRRGVPIDTWYMGVGVCGEHFRAVVDAVSVEMVWRQLELLFGTVRRHDIIERPMDWEPPHARPFVGVKLRTLLPDKVNRYVKVKERKTIK